MWSSWHLYDTTRTRTRPHHLCESRECRTAAVTFCIGSPVSVSPHPEVRVVDDLLTAGRSGPSRAPDPLLLLA